MIIINIDYIIKFKEEDNIADIDNGDNNNNSNNENNHENCIYYSIISNNTCSNLYLYWKIQNINNNDGNQKYFGPYEPQRAIQYNEGGANRTWNLICPVKSTIQWGRGKSNLRPNVPIKRKQKLFHFFLCVK